MVDACLDLSQSRKHIPRAGRKLIVIGFFVILLLLLGLILTWQLKDGPHSNHEKMDNLNVEAITNVEDSSELSIQGNFTNWGNSCCDSANIYISDLWYGIYKVDKNNITSELSYELIARGYYSDLAVVGDYIYGIKTENDSSYVVRIDTLSLMEEQISDKYPNASLIGQDLDNGLYFFTVNQDRLLYIDRNNEVSTTEYRNVVKMTKWGVFSTASGKKGITYTSFGDMGTKTYDNLENHECNVAFSSEKTAVIYETSDDMNAVYELDLKTGETNPLFKEVIDNATGIISLMVNVNNNSYFLGVSCENEQGQSINSVYRYSLLSHDTELLFSSTCDRDRWMPFTATSIIDNDILVTSYPLAAVGKFRISTLDGKSNYELTVTETGE